MVSSVVPEFSLLRYERSLAAGLRLVEHGSQPMTDVSLLFHSDPASLPQRKMQVSAKFKILMGGAVVHTKSTEC
jgi:hypothetical protein